MAIPSTGTVLTSGGTTTSGILNTVNIATFTTTANYLVVALVANGRGSTASGGGTITVSDSFTGSIGVWTTIDSIIGTGSAGDSKYRVSGWWATAGGATTGTVRFVSSGSGSERRWAWEIITFSGQTAVNFIGTTGQLSSTATNITITLGTLGATHRAVGFAASNDGSLMTAGTNEIEIVKVSGGVSPSLFAESIYGTEVAVDWISLQTRNNLAIAWTIIGSADAGVTWILERIEHQYGRGIGRGYARGMG